MQTRLGWQGIASPTIFSIFLLQHFQIHLPGQFGNVSHFERYKWHRNTDYRSENENRPEDAISPTLQNTIMEITRLYTPGQVIWKVRKPLKLSDGNKLMSAICLQSVCSFRYVAIRAILYHSTLTALSGENIRVDCLVLVVDLICALGKTLQCSKFDFHAGIPEIQL